ncbi:hypothetical protein A3K42_01610 [candidate division WWE3 bacterium RBG_13_37_7]|uniref:Heat-inducible transcription repressor HrcA n=1 Tax=candidate division WWE3 bacterium RBG_13_37_7 TaxID=1802609 RepID=A0A1F4U1T5_UNCKA|nr:MAG: hypothetical protein A3K42_01610 [candidate division WWE3 bacterium RBG_13_37_7]
MLSERQIQLLNAIIKEHTQSAEPVGSVEIVSKYKLRCSPATIRNEMAKLISMGYLEMFHTSSGRIPTKLAYKLYLEDILEEVEMPVLQEVAMKQRLWESRYEMAKMLRNAAIVLADTANVLAITTENDGFVSYAGIPYLLDNKEFEDTKITKTLFTILDNWEAFDNLLKSNVFGGEVKFLIGDELGIKNLERCALVYTDYAVGNKQGYVAIFGPARMPYPSIVPALKYTKGLIQELGETW